MNDPDSISAGDNWRSCAVPAPQHAAYAASFVNDQYSPGDPGYADAKSLQWWSVPDYPIARLNDAPDASWFKDERDMWADEGQPDRFDDMLDQPILCPIIVYDTPSGGWIWDGNHRVGACVSRGLTSVPALVGTRIEKENGQ